MDRPYRRRNYLVNRRYQGRYVAAVLGICAAGLSLSLGLFNFFSYRELESAGWRVHMDAMSIGQMLQPYLVYSQVTALAFTVLVLVLFSVYSLQRTAPPMYRLKKFIESVEDGNLNVELVWVANDEFRDAAEELNCMARALRERFMAIRRECREVEHMAAVMQYKGPDAEEMKELMQRLTAMKRLLRGEQE